ncbi:lysoplasmalogenase family protein [Christiangramia salexigens]|uniref:YhhN-like protein n=1 Tax=Christiangramia salexigens TaxID=1913577 RepID=A0A1L3J4X1_9FLAO|nr:lysoplasmalogenase family protein [Christiangramia salexigens]APG60175.1 hypothetical protein LPB144_07005 [Christiangramia salexigens]
MPPKLLLPILTIFLLVANIFVISEFEMDYSRWSRLISTGLYFLVLLWQNTYGKRIFWVFVLFLIADILLFQYENNLVNTATFLIRITAYILLVLTVAPELRNLKTNLFQKVVFGVVLGLNLGMLFFLLEMVPSKFKYPFLEFFFVIYGMSMIALVIAAISYNNRYANKISFYFTAGTLFLVFSDITSFIAYYLEFSEFYYADRIFYLLGAAVLVKFTLFNRSHEAVPEFESL